MNKDADLNNEKMVEKCCSCVGWGSRSGTKKRWARATLTHLHADADSFGCRYRLGTASNLVMYVSAADNDYVGVTGTFLGTPSQGVWSTARLDFSAPPGGIAKLRFVAFRRVYPRAGAAVGGHAGPVQHADQGKRLRGRVCLSNGPAGGLAGPHGLGHAGRAHRAGQRGLRPAAVQRRDTTGVDASGAISCAALTAGAVAGATLTSTGAVSGSSLSISGAASVGLLSSATGITGSTLTINNTANAGNFTTVGDVSTGTLTASGAARCAGPWPPCSAKPSTASDGAVGAVAQQPPRVDEVPHMPPS